MCKNSMALKIALLIIGLLSSVGCNADKRAADTNTKDRSGKFHLIYLVSAVDLKPGAKVFVDPIFFTDGKDIKGFHQYCKTKKKSLTDDKIHADMSVIHNYCANQLFSFTPKDYHILNNHGATLKINHINFTSSKSVIDEPVMMGHAKIISAREGSIELPKLLRADTAPQYFFLMAKEKNILESIVPISKAQKGDMATLLERAKRAVEQTRGKRLVYSEKIWLDPQYKYKAINDATLTNPIFTDIDADGTLDLIIGMSASFRSLVDLASSNVEWFAVAYIMGSEKRVLGKYVVKDMLGKHTKIIPRGPNKQYRTSVDSYARYINNNYPIMSPLVAVRMGGCGYVLRYLSETFMQYPFGIDFESVTFNHQWYRLSTKDKGTGECMDIRFDKLKIPM